MDIMALVARLTLDKSQYDKGLDDAASGAKSFGDKLKGGLGTAAKVGAAAVTAVASAATAMTKAVIDGTGQVAAYGDNIDKASQKLGLSAEAYQEWDAVLQHSGTSIDSLGTGLKTLSTKAASGSDAFKKLGISQKQAASMSREELFSKTITALQNVQNENERSALAMELFGKSAMELGPLLNTSAADTQAMKDRVHELGGVMSNDAVKAAAAYQDSLQDMTTAFDGLKRNLMSEFLPSITTVMDGLTDLFTTGGTDKISEGISQFVDKIGEVVPRILEKGSQIVLSLAKAIVDNLPKLIDAAVSAILTFAQGIVKELPTIVKAGLQIILSLAQSIADALPELIPTIVEVMLEIVDVLTDPSTLSNLVDAAIQIIIALAEGLIEALPKLIEKAPEIIANIVGALIENAPKLLLVGPELILQLGKGIIQSVGGLLDAIGTITSTIADGISEIVTKAWEWGKDLIMNFWEGLKAFMHKPIDAIKGLAGKIKNFLGFSEPSEGPLSDFHTYAPDMMELYAKGIRDNTDLVEDAVEDTAQTVSDTMSEPVPSIASSLDAIKSLWEKLISNVDDDNDDFEGLVQNFIDNLVNIGKKLKPHINTIINGIKDMILTMIPDIGDRARGLIDKIVGAVLDSALDWGRDLIQNFIDGINQMWQALKQKVSDVGSLIKSFLGFSEPEEGPLSNFHTYAPDMMALFAQGIKDNEDVVKDQIDKSFDFGTQITSSVPEGSTQEVVVPVSGDSSSNKNLTVILNVGKEELGRIVTPLVQAELQRLGVRLVTGGVY